MKTGGAVRKSILLAASAAVALLALGCGEQKEKAAVEISAAPAVQEQTPANVATASTITPEAGPTEESGGTTSAESLPPDVSASAPDSLVIPGNVVEITAQASTDATSLMLQDRMGNKCPFEYDAEAKAWRVHYRVPIRTEVDRLGLSVTATNGANRWKRVWVFLKIEDGVPAAESNL